MIARIPLDRTPMSLALTLYGFVDIDRSSRVRWLCLELGIPFTEKRLNYTAAEQRSEAYRRINPFSRVPGLESEVGTLFESGAICQFLAERHPQHQLVPEIGAPERGRYLSWMFFATSTFDPAAFGVFHSTALRPNPERRKQAIEEIQPLLAGLSDQVRSNHYVLGARFSVPDIVLGHALVLLRGAQALDQYPELLAYIDRLAQRPAAARSRLFGPRKAA
jgi:glutathione S-transferase